jgi:hypothetical protein
MTTSCVEAYIFRMQRKYGKLKCKWDFDDPDYRIVDVHDLVEVENIDLFEMLRTMKLLAGNRDYFKYERNRWRSQVEDSQTPKGNYVEIRL